MILAADDNCPVVIQNLTMVKEFLRDEDPEQGGGEAAGVRIFFKAVVQSVLIFGEEIWLVTPHMGQVMGGF